MAKFEEEMRVKAMSEAEREAYLAEKKRIQDEKDAAERAIVEEEERKKKQAEEERLAAERKMEEEVNAAKKAVRSKSSEQLRIDTAKTTRPKKEKVQKTVAVEKSVDKKSGCKCLIL